MTHVSGTSGDGCSARLPVVRYFSDLCSRKFPDAGKQALIARIRELEAMSDEALSDLGLLREDIVDHVFRDAHFV
ncbi:MAG: DUF1127 domain-containing protein [Tropicimonas sp.]|uniref:DUF1127 domain-containing protein n=1 Tax=Tropicimonas sp. TaxID=2067044 RepID=UPI003A8524D0